jgi:hypothetical protein
LVQYVATKSADTPTAKGEFDMSVSVPVALSNSKPVIVPSALVASFAEPREKNSRWKLMINESVEVDS